MMLTPEESIRIQNAIGADIMMQVLVSLSFSLSLSPSKHLPALWCCSLRFSWTMWCPRSPPDLESLRLCDARCAGLIDVARRTNDHQSRHSLPLSREGSTRNCERSVCVASWNETWTGKVARERKKERRRKETCQGVADHSTGCSNAISSAETFFF